MSDHIPLSFGKKLTRLFRDIVQEPAVSISLGSIFMSASQGGWTGMVSNTVALTAVLGTTSYESWTGRKLGKPFGVLAVANAATAADIAYTGFNEHGVSAEVVPQVLMSLAYAFWCVRSSLLFWQRRRGIEPENFTNDPQFYQGVGALFAAKPNLLPKVVSSNPAAALPVLFSVLGTLRTVVDDRGKDNDSEGNERSFLFRHATAPRLYASQYASSIMFASDWKQAAAFLLWTWAFTQFDGKLNRELYEEIKKIFTLEHPGP